MAGFRQSVVPSVATLLRRLRAIEGHLRRLDDLWDRFADLMVELENELWETHDWGKWPPLSASTIRQKSMHGYPIDPMIRTGDLKASLTDKERAMGGFALGGVRGSTRFIWGTDVEYASYHQEPEVPGQPPQRKIIDVDGKEDRFQEEMVHFANQVLRHL